MMGETKEKGAIEMKLEGFLLSVTDMARSRQFYETVLGRKVIQDFGANLTFEGGPVLQARFTQMLGLDPATEVKRSHNAELYFEEEKIDEFVKSLEQMGGIQYVHPLLEQPWGQRVVRFYDPDGHIIEVGEPMDCVVGRLLREGMPAEQVAERTMFPLEFVRMVEEQSKR